MTWNSRKYPFSKGTIKLGYLRCILWGMVYAYFPEDKWSCSFMVETQKEKNTPSSHMTWSMNSILLFYFLDTLSVGGEEADLWAFVFEGCMLFQKLLYAIRRAPSLYGISSTIKFCFIVHEFISNGEQRQWTKLWKLCWYSRSSLLAVFFVYLLS